MASKKRLSNSYKMPEALPQGEILTDVREQKWIIGPSIGVVGFGEIYSAASYTGEIPKHYPFVVRIGLHENGSFFVETQFYRRNAQMRDIEAWKKKKKLRHLGMPKFISSGTHTYHNRKYRFVVMNKYGRNLWDVFLENNRKFPEPTVYKVALQILNVLEYMHDKGYAHGNIRGTNLVLSLESSDRVFLIDAKLASHSAPQTVYNADPINTYYSWIEYTSRDTHVGYLTMRGDIEILGYNMVQWLSSSLPWERSLTDPNEVQQQKNNAFSDRKEFLKNCFPNGAPDTLDKFFRVLSTMESNETPIYDAFKDILVKGIKDCGEEPEGKLDFVNKDESMKTPTKAADVSIGQTRQSLRLQNVFSPNSTADELNDSDNLESDGPTTPSLRPHGVPSPTPTVNEHNDRNNLGSAIIYNQTKFSEKKRIVMNVEVTDESDMEVEIKVTKKRKNGPDVVKKTILRKAPKRLAEETQNVAPKYNLVETQVPIHETRSRPKVTRKVSYVVKKTVVKMPTETRHF